MAEAAGPVEFTGRIVIAIVHADEWSALEPDAAAKRHRHFRMKADTAFINVSFALIATTVATIDEAQHVGSHAIRISDLGFGNKLYIVAAPVRRTNVANRDKTSGNADAGGDVHAGCRREALPQGHP